MRWLTQLVLRRPRAVIGAWIFVLAAAAPFAMKLTGDLKAGGFNSPRSEAIVTQSVLKEAFGESPDSLLVVLQNPDGDVTTSLPAAKAAVARPEVTSVTDYTKQPTWLSKDRHTTFLQLGFGVSNTAVQNLTPVLEREVGAALHGVQVHVTGQPALDYQLNVHSKEDAERAEMIAFPVLFIVLLLVFRSVAAMVVPLLLAGATLVTTQALGYGVAQATDLSILFSNILTMVGLAVSVDYSLFIIKRYREELAKGASVPDALTTTMATTGHSVMFSGLAVVVALSTLFIPRIMAFTSIATGGVLVTAVAMAVSTTLLPAVLALMGHGINWGKVPLGSRTTRPAGEHGRIDRLTGRLHGKPALVLTGVLVGFAVLAFPASKLHIQVPVASASILPADDGARIGMEQIRDNLGVRGMFPVEVVLSTPQSGNPQALLATATKVGDYLKTKPEAANVLAVTNTPAAAKNLVWGTAGGRTVTRLVITPQDEPDSDATHQLVKDLRNDLPDLAAPGVKVDVAGATAQGVDFDKIVIHSAPVIIGVVAVATFIILALAFGSFLLPLLALAFNILIVAGSLGALTLIFQDGLNRSINSVTPLLLFAVMFGLSMDYMVIMISRVREAKFTDGLPHPEAVRAGLRQTAGLVNGAAIIMIAVFTAFLTAKISIVAELGTGLAIAVALDALIIPLALMPSTLLLIGNRVWGKRTPRGHSTAPLEGAQDGGNRDEHLADATVR
jgi:RND superfamily putative drug exporter